MSNRLLLLFSVYLLTLAPTITWYDTGELTVGAFLLGNGHPPGQPLYAMMAKIATLFPFGSIPFRISVLSALCSGLAIAALPALVRRLTSLYSSIHIDVVLSGIGLALPIWLQSVRIELYALQLVLTVFIVARALRFGTPDDTAGNRIAVAFLSGLLLTVHPLLGVLLAPGLVVLWSFYAGRTLPYAITGGLFGFSVYLYGPIRSNAGALLDWGRPNQLEPFVAVVTGRSYQRSFVHLTIERLWINLDQHRELFVTCLGAPTLILALIGWGLLFRRPRYAIAIAVLLVGNIVATASQSLFSPENPDALGYLTFGFVLVWCLAAIGLDGLGHLLLLRLSHSRKKLLVLPLVLLVTLSPAMRAWPQPDLHDNWTNHQFTKHMLESLPPGTLFFTSSDSTSLSVMYAQTIEGRRPDVESLSLYTIVAQGPLRNALDVPEVKTFRIEPATDRALALMEREIQRRPIHFAANDLPLGIDSRLRAAPFSFRLVKEDETVPLDQGLDKIASDWVRLGNELQMVPAYLRDRQARYAFPAHIEALGDHFKRLGLLRASLQMYSAAEVLDPDTTRLVRLKRYQTEQMLEESLPLAADGSSVILRSRDPALQHSWTLYQRGDFQQLREELRALRMMRLEPEPVLELLLKTWQVLPQVEMESWLLQLLQRTSSAEAIYLTSTVWWHMGDIKRAEALLERAHPRSSSHCIRIGYAWILAAQGRYQEAHALVVDAAKEDSMDPDLLRITAYLYRNGVR